MRSTELMLMAILLWPLNKAATIYREVLINATMDISCIPNETIQIQWHHTKPHESKNKYIYAGGKFYDSYDERFRMKIDSNTGPYHLVILNARYEDAGLYQCKEDTGSRVFSSTFLTVESSPVCETNMKPEGYVGPNTCNLQPEDMTFTCAVSFNGIPPQMIWTSLNDSQIFSESTCKNEQGRINCSLIKSAESMYDGTIFNCKSRNSTVNCSTEIIKIHYFESDHLPVDKIVGDKVNCTAKSNQILQYKWTLVQGDGSVTFPENQELLIQSTGFYRCFVEYRIRNEACEARATGINANDPKPCKPAQGVTTPTIVLSIFLGIVSGVIIGLIYCLRKELRQKYLSSCSFLVDWWNRMHLSHRESGTATNRDKKNIQKSDEVEESCNMSVSNKSGPEQHKQPEHEKDSLNTCMNKDEHEGSNTTPATDENRTEESILLKKI